jgi:uncharacterized protein (DUF924 family)
MKVLPCNRTREYANALSRCCGCIDYHAAMISSDAIDTDAQSVLAFWFGKGDERGKSRAQWFRKDLAFDEEIRRQFLTLYRKVAAGEYDHWKDNALDCLALIVVLDQFPRNLFRDSAEAFATDAAARAATRHMLARGDDARLLPVEREFVYLPLEHSESLADQDECLRLMKSLSVFDETRDLHVWAEKHRVIIERFGRFPHRNAALGRESTAEEIAFLQQPGSRF